MTTQSDMIKMADISECGKYRYKLLRIWEPERVVLSWCMLNPSTADAEVDDPTIRRCIGFSKRWGFGAIQVFNLFAYRATDPKELGLISDPVGPGNEKMLSSLRGPIVVGWGARLPRGGLSKMVIRILKNCAEEDQGGWYCLGRTKNGEPKHPLMLSYSQQVERWP